MNDVLILYCVPLLLLLIAIGSSNTSASRINVINTVTTHVRMKPTFTGRRQIQVNCSNPNINQYTTASTSTTAVNYTKQTSSVTTSSRRTTSLSPSTTRITPTLTVILQPTTFLSLLTTHQTSRPTTQQTTKKAATGLFKNFVYLNNKCTVPFDDIPGWTVIQRRCNGVVDFNRTYADYENGFGDQNGEIWIGNEWLYNNTVNSPLVLRVDFQDSNGQQYNAIYNSFQVGSSSTNYTLSIGGFTGNSSDALGTLNNMAFSSFDADNDNDARFDCAGTYGGFWYDVCGPTFPNNIYVASTQYLFGIYWHPIQHIPFFQMRVYID